MTATQQPQPEPPQPQPHANVQKWTVAVLAGLGVILALIIIATLSVGGLEKKPRPIIQNVRVSAGDPVQSVVYLSVSPGVKPGPDGKLHDAYSQTTFHVHAGKPVKLVIDNTDSVPHGIVSSAAGVSLVVKPGKHTYTLLVRRPGSYVWHCNQPCDPYSMMRMDYMMGRIIAD